MSRWEAKRIPKSRDTFLRYSLSQSNVTCVTFEGRKMKKNHSKKVFISMKKKDRKRDREKTNGRKSYLKTESAYINPLCSPKEDRQSILLWVPGAVIHAYTLCYMPISIIIFKFFYHFTRIHILMKNLDNCWRANFLWFFKLASSSDLATISTLLLRGL